MDPRHAAEMARLKEEADKLKADMDSMNRQAEVRN